MLDGDATEEVHTSTPQHTGAVDDVALAVDMTAWMRRQSPKQDPACSFRKPGTRCACTPPRCDYTSAPSPSDEELGWWQNIWAALCDLWSALRGKGRKKRLPRLWAAWREIALGRINVARAELAEVHCTAAAHDLDCLATLNGAKECLDLARDAVERPPGLLGAWSGVDVERAWVNIHAAEVALIRLSSPVAVKAKIPNVIFDAQHVLGRGDKRFKSLDEYNKQKKLKPDDRAFIAESVKTVYAETTRSFIRARSFRNILFATTFILTLFAITFGVLSSYGQLPQVIMCGPGPNCPSDSPALQVWQVEVLGLFGAGVIGSVAIRRMRGSSQPYAVPMASLLVKLPLGALTATGGLILVRSGLFNQIFLSLNTGQLVAFAVIFGASQQTFTQLIDRQAQQVLDHIPTAGRGVANSTSTDEQS